MASHQIPAFGFPWHGALCVPGRQPQNLFHFRLEQANGSRHHLVNGTATSLTQVGLEEILPNNHTQLKCLKKAFKLEVNQTKYHFPRLYNHFC